MNFHHGVSRAAAVPRWIGLHLPADVLAVDTADAAPESMARFRAFNPFHHDPEWRIPIPGQTSKAQSVESIWQGLKVIGGIADFAMLGSRATKRPPESTRVGSYSYRETVFRFGEAEIGMLEARLAVYLPAYLFVLEHYIPKSILQEIESHLDSGLPVAFYDWDDNFSIVDTSRSFSHSAILASYFNRNIEEEFGALIDQFVRTDRKPHLPTSKQRSISPDSRP